MAFVAVMLTSCGEFDKTQILGKWQVDQLRTDSGQLVDREAAQKLPEMEGKMSAFDVVLEFDDDAVYMLMAVPEGMTKEELQEAGAKFRGDLAVVDTMMWQVENGSAFMKDKDEERWSIISMDGDSFDYQDTKFKRMK